MKNYTWGWSDIQEIYAVFSIKMIMKGIGKLCCSHSALRVSFCVRTHYFLAVTISRPAPGYQKPASGPGGLGHEDLATTDIYTHIVNEDLEDAMKTLGMAGSIDFERFNIKNCANMRHTRRVACLYKKGASDFDRQRGLNHTFFGIQQNAAI